MKAPPFIPPRPIEPPDFVRPAMADPLLIADTKAPNKPTFGEPKHGADWSGTKPFEAPLPRYVEPLLMSMPMWRNPETPAEPKYEVFELRPNPYLKRAAPAEPSPMPSPPNLSPESSLSSFHFAYEDSEGGSRPGSPIGSLPGSRPASALPSASDAGCASDGGDGSAPGSGPAPRVASASGRASSSRIHSVRSCGCDKQ